MSRINWDYAFGLIMGVVVCKAAENLYTHGFRRGLNCAREINNVVFGVGNSIVENDGEES